MLMSRASKVNEVLVREHMSTDEFWYLLMCSGQMPASIKDLETKSPDELMKMADCGIIKVEGRRDQPSKEIVRFVHSDNVTTAFGMACDYNMPIPKRHFRQPQSNAFKGTVKHYDFPNNGNEFGTSSLQFPNMRMIYPHSVSTSCLDTAYYTYNQSSLFIEMEETGLRADSLAMNGYFQNGSSNTFYSYYRVSYETETDFEQIDATLDLTSAVQGNTVRLRNVDALPEEIKVGVSDSDRQYLQNHTTVTRQADDAEYKWVVNTIVDSHGWITLASGGYSYNSNVPFNWDSYDESVHHNVARFYRIERYSSGDGNYMYWYLGHLILRSNTPKMYKTPNKGYIAKDVAGKKLEATWGILVPNFQSAPRNEITKAVPMLLVDIGGPNDGKAVALSESRDLDETSEPVLMNLKTKIGVLVEKVVTPPVVE